MAFNAVLTVESFLKKRMSKVIDKIQVGDRTVRLVGEAIKYAFKDQFNSYVKTPNIWIDNSSVRTFGAVYAWYLKEKARSFIPVWTGSASQDLQYSININTELVGTKLPGGIQLSSFDIKLFYPERPSRQERSEMMQSIIYSQWVEETGKQSTQTNLWLHPAINSMDRVIGQYPGEIQSEIRSSVDEAATQVFERDLIKIKELFDISVTDADETSPMEFHLEVKPSVINDLYAKTTQLFARNEALIQEVGMLRYQAYQSGTTYSPSQLSKIRTDRRMEHVRSFKRKK